MDDLQNNIEVPIFYICPISLEIMNDPVTLSTGITYNRDSIEKWLFSYKNRVCPVTKQVVLDIKLTPNHTLQRLIQSWCALNPSTTGVEILPSPRFSIKNPQIIKLLQDSKSPHLQTKSLKTLKSIVFANENNKLLMESVGAADYLASILNNDVSSPAGEISGADDALTILYHLNLSPTSLKSLLEKDGSFMETLTNMMTRATSYETRAYSIMLIKSMLDVANPMQLTLLNPKFFMQLAQMLKDQISKQATKATLKVLINVCGYGRNRIKAAEEGVVAVLIDSLLNTTEKRVSEMMIVVLDRICECAEGRAELLKHDGGLAVVSKRILRVSRVGSEKAVRILRSVAVYSGNRRVLGEMMEVGVVRKLCLVVQVDCGKKMKGYAKEILKMHYSVWKSCCCIPCNLISSYPS
ncbi:hypothetical protein QVD17_32709 [Tagetes erecta]|uniref:U-box domain-containing protein n=1 Tax=Tagetes erecta TaxID=13708 RepID=A0AAD8JW03_TARER|nr:hypothetical protein QVD17_32709 [Tagetes erecta]